MEIINDSIGFIASRPDLFSKKYYSGQTFLWSVSIVKGEFFRGNTFRKGVTSLHNTSAIF